jgi:hypothetical protein
MCSTLNRENKKGPTAVPLPFYGRSDRFPVSVNGEFILIAREVWDVAIRLYPDRGCVGGMALIDAIHSQSRSVQINRTNNEKRQLRR